MLTPKIFSLPTASCSISLSRKSSNLDALLKPNFFVASAVLIVASSKSASKGSIQPATSLNRPFPLLRPLILILTPILLFVFHKAAYS
jgi:hypothetical protein